MNQKINKAGNLQVADFGALADQAYAEYNFGDRVEVTDASGWEYLTPGFERTRKVHVEAEREDDGPAPRWTLTFTVRFNPADGSLSEAYAIDCKGQIWGSMPDRKLPEITDDDIETVRAVGFAVDQESAVDGQPANGRWRWTLTQPAWTQATTCRGDFGSEKDAWADAVRSFQGDGGLRRKLLEIDPEIAEAIIGNILNRVKNDGVPVNASNAIKCISEVASAYGYELSDAQVEALAPRVIARVKGNETELEQGTLPGVQTGVSASVQDAHDCQPVRRIYFVADEGFDVIEAECFLLDGFIEEGGEPAIEAIYADPQEAERAARRDDPSLILDVFPLDYNGQMTLTEIRIFFGCEMKQQEIPTEPESAALKARPNTIAKSILAAAQRMRAAGVVIEVNTAEPTVKIYAHAVPYITRGGTFTVSGESADGLICEAHAYVGLAETVTFDEAMAFTVDGYLDDFIELPETVQDAINSGFWSDLHPEIAGIEPDSVVGEAVVALLNDIEAVCTRIYAEDGGAVESNIVESMKALAYRQCRVWYFG